MWKVTVTRIAHGATLHNKDPGRTRLHPQFTGFRTETQTTESLSQLRKQIDECDDNIIQELAKRMRIAREIGTYKKEHGITVLQAGRYNEILEKRGAQGEQCGMDAEFMKKIFEAIHEESVRQQMEIINK